MKNIIILFLSILSFAATAQQQTINNGESGAVVRGKLNSMFSDLYTNKVSLTGVQLLTNKSISGATNTFSNIPASAIVGGAQTVLTGLVTGGSDGTVNLGIINAALVASNGEEIIWPAGDYVVSGPIDITSYTKHIRLTILGNLYFSGNGLIVGNSSSYLQQYVNVYGQLIGPGFGHGVDYDAYPEAVGFHIKNSSYGQYYTGDMLYWTEAIRMESSAGIGSGCLHNHVKFRTLSNNELAINLVCTGPTNSYVNQNYFYGGNIAGKNGIKFTKNTGQVDPFNGNTFYGVCTEGVTTGPCWDIDFAHYNTWIAGRSNGAENPGSSDRFKFSATTNHNRIIGYLQMDAADITDAGFQNYYGNGSIRNWTDNTSAGDGTLAALTSGSRNIALGTSTLAALTTGASNVAIGHQALQNSNATGNIAIGEQALKATSGIGENTAVGYFALSKVTTSGGISVAIGAFAGVEQTTGGGNVLVGNGAGERNQTGSSNVNIGYQAGRGVASNSYSQNTFIGNSAGRVVTTGGNNIAVGYGAGDNITSGGRNVIIGGEVDAQSATASNQVSIANVFLAQGASGTATTLAGTAGIAIIPTTTARLTLPASTTAIAPLNIAAGTAPSAPVDGDIWVEGTDIKIRLAGTTYTLTKTP